MADLVSEESEFSCNFCTSKLKLSVSSSSSKGDSKKLANQTNCFFPPPGGNCTFPPGVPPSPCPGLPPGCVTSTGQSTVTVDDQTALGKGCMFMCPKGQPVSLSQSGQAIAKHNEAEGGEEGPSLTSTLISLVLDCLPFIGSGKSVVELVTGKDAVTGEEVSRIASAAGIALGVVPGLKGAAKGAMKVASKGSKGKGIAKNYKASSATNRVNLNKSLASEQQMGEVGTTIAGNGSKVPFRGAKNASEKYGGDPSDWAKKSSSSHTAPDGTTFETHWIENAATGQKFEYKTKLGGAK